MIIHQNCFPLFLNQKYSFFNHALTITHTVVDTQCQVSLLSCELLTANPQPQASSIDPSCQLITHLHPGKPTAAVFSFFLFFFPASPLHVPRCPICEQMLYNCRDYRLGLHLSVTHTHTEAKQSSIVPSLHGRD